ncbi:hypothetical protein AA098_03690 [Pseudomonas sp. JY-Q]|nr:hypothetical protein AA098_03690 [Pseudomonas sp. JY-Q]
MQAQWNALQAALLVPEYPSEQTVVEPYFLRMLMVFGDAKAGSADRAVACRDAFGCAHAHGCTDLLLQLPAGSVEKQHLSRVGLAQDPLTDRIRLKIAFEETDLAVYRRQRRRFLHEPQVDVALSSALGRVGFSNYNGLGQQVAVRTLLTSPDDSTVFINLPTGCGKTLAVHALSLFAYRQKVVLVIVPTTGLAIEQAVRAGEVLEAAGCDHGGSYVWIGGQEETERREIRERLRCGTQRILFCAPESAISGLRPSLFELAGKGLLGALVIDEAHLVGQWGAEFRPDFQLLAPLFHSLREHSSSGIRTLLMSATFNFAALEVLKEAFVPEGTQAIEINGSFLRPELDFNVLRTPAEEEHRQVVVDLLWRLPRPLILYTTTRADAQNWRDQLVEQGFRRLGLFHGETNTQERERLIGLWQDDHLDIMVATSAFGVGMDKRDVRSVLHAAVPENLDRFYQEAGRAGRDGNACWSWLVFYPGQIKVAEQISRARLISSEVGLDRWNTLLQSRRRSSDGCFSVSLSMLRRDLRRRSEGNAEWNVRTLLLMQRAGLIRLRYSPPEADYENTAVDDTDALQSDNYFDRIDVEILIDAHQSKDIWQRYVDPQRAREQQAMAEGFASLRQCLDDPDQSMCQLLEEFYRLDGVSPERSCGGCPGCRSQGRGPFTPTLGASFHVVGVVPPVMPKWMPESQLQRIRYRTESYRSVTPRALIHNWRRWMVTLLRSQEVQAVRASRALLDEIKKDAGFKALPFWCALEPFDTAGGWTELVLLMPDEVHLPTRGFEDTARLIVAPETLGDPYHPYRNWWECDSNSRDLVDFEREI